MPTGNSFKIRTKSNNLFLRVSKGHFATSNSHTNYYIDVTTHKARLSEASAVAKELVSYYNLSTIVDTILCLDGTEVIGTCLAKELTKGNFVNLNSHQTIYVVTPEQLSGNQFIFRENILPMIKGKNILILSASITTGNAVLASMNAVKYYGGIIAGACAIFSTIDSVDDILIHSAFKLEDLPDYESHAPHECPLCKNGEKLDALVNSFGFAKL